MKVFTTIESYIVGKPNSIKCNSFLMYPYCAQKKSGRMKIDNFVKFAENYQIQYINQYGKYVMMRKGRRYRYILVYLEIFFVEIAYDLETRTIEYIYPFADTEYLSPYLEEITI